MIRPILRYVSIALAATLAMTGTSVGRAQTPTTKVPQCLLQKDTVKIYVPCTGVVPVDSDSGNAIKWQDLFDRVVSTPTGTAGSPNVKVVSVQGVVNGTPVPAAITNTPSVSVTNFPSSQTVTNTGFAINGTLPAFAVVPTFNLGTLNGAATAANQTTMVAKMPDVATAGSATPNTGLVLMGHDGTNAKRACTDGNGILCAPKAGTANRVITKTSVAANTSTAVCPIATNPVTTELQFSAANVGMGFNGQSLTSAVLGTGAGDADMVSLTANVPYIFPVAPTNAVTAYATTSFVAACIQTLRQ